MALEARWISFSGCRWHPHRFECCWSKVKTPTASPSRTTFDFADDDDAATLSAADQVISAILGTREGATEAGHALTSTGVTWTDPVDAAALRDALATRKVENVMLVSSFMAAAALAQAVGCTVGDAHTALLFLEPDTATLAVIDSADGSITDVHKELISDGTHIAELAGMVGGAGPWRPARRACSSSAPVWTSPRSSPNWRR